MIADIEPQAITRGDRAVVDYGQDTEEVSTSIGTIISTLPYDTNFGQATTESFNSNRGGEYIFSLNGKQWQYYIYTITLCSSSSSLSL